MNSLAPLKLMPNEDATVGFWLTGMHVRRIDHPKVRAAAGACCFYSYALLHSASEHHSCISPRAAACDVLHPRSYRLVCSMLGTLAYKHCSFNNKHWTVLAARHACTTVVLSRGLQYLFVCLCISPSVYPSALLSVCVYVCLCLLATCPCAAIHTQTSLWSISRFILFVSTNHLQTQAAG